MIEIHNGALAHPFVIEVPSESSWITASSNDSNVPPQPRKRMPPCNSNIASVEVSYYANCHTPLSSDFPFPEPLINICAKHTRTFQAKCSTQCSSRWHTDTQARGCWRRFWSLWGHCFCIDFQSAFWWSLGSVLAPSWAPQGAIWEAKTAPKSIPKRSKIEAKNQESKKPIQDDLGPVLGRSWAVLGAILGPWKRSGTTPADVS